MSLVVSLHLEGRISSIATSPGDAKRPWFSQLLSQRQRNAYSEERDSNDDTPVLRVGDLVDGAADVGVGLGGAAEASASDTLGRHI